MNALAAVPAAVPDEATGRLLALLRPEFNVAVVRPEPDDPVLAGAPCEVDGCDRPARSRGLCAAHRSRWAQHGKPDLAIFIATAAPVRPGRARADEVFDLSLLPSRCRLELALVLQRRHDERGRGLRPMAVRPVVAMIAGSGVGSLLDRPLEDWVAALPPGSRTSLASATGFLREVHIQPPPAAQIFESVECASCGEPTMETRLRRLDGRELCLVCFDEALGGTIPVASPTPGRR